jgi:hypothetical protein
MSYVLDCEGDHQLLALCALCSMLCSVSSAVRSGSCVLRSLLRALCCVLCSVALRSVFHAFGSMLCALCGVSCVRCYL